MVSDEAILESKVYFGMTVYTTAHLLTADIDGGLRRVILPIATVVLAVLAFHAWLSLVFR